MVKEGLIEKQDKCPKCNNSYIYDIGYDNSECPNCGNVWKCKSKTGLEINNI
jgi:ribosomal protein S27AE